MKKTTAIWNISLTCDCPHCNEFVDLLDESEFWGWHHFEAAEHGTDRTKDVEVECPECHEEFIVDLEY